MGNFDKHNIKVLIVDDHKSFRNILKSILIDNNYTVREAGTGKEGFKKVNQTFFNIAILDYKLPDTNGIELARKIRKLNDKTEVLILTGKASLDSAINAVKEDNISSYMLKPVEPQKLLEVMEGILEEQFLIMENRKLLSNLKKSNEIFRRLSEFKDCMISMISHDMRSPLSSIRGFNKVLLEEYIGKLSNSQREIINNSEKVLDSMVDLMNKILDMRQIEAGEFKVSKEPTNLKKEVILPVVKKLEPDTEKNRFRLSLNYNTDVMTTCIDGDRIRQVVQNLIQNAFEFTSGGGKITITVTSPKENLIQVRVEDPGKGMTQETMDTIFKAFYLQNSEKQKVRGKGRGLSLVISKEIINAHGGKIWVESQGMGRGSEFIFQLPVNLKS